MQQRVPILQLKTYAENDRGQNSQQDFTTETREELHTDNTNEEIKNNSSFHKNIKNEHNTLSLIDQEYYLTRLSFH